MHMHTYIHACMHASYIHIILTYNIHVQIHTYTHTYIHLKKSSHKSIHTHRRLGDKPTAVERKLMDLVCQNLAFLTASQRPKALVTPRAVQVWKKRVCIIYIYIYIYI